MISLAQAILQACLSHTVLGDSLHSDGRDGAQHDDPDWKMAGAGLITAFLGMWPHVQAC